MLMNYNDTLDAVFTLAHELGHSMHTMRSHQTQLDRRLARRRVAAGVDLSRPETVRAVSAQLDGLVDRLEKEPS